MKIVLIGYGKMGKAVRQVAERRGHDIVSVIAPDTDPKLNIPAYVEISAEAVREAEVVIDFSHPSCAISNIEAILPLQLPMVVGTTGWHAERKKVEALVKEHQGSVLYSSNFSLGVQLFAQITRQATRLMNKFEEYDVSGLELHHKHKADSPSGTARMLAEVILEENERKEEALYDRTNKQINPEQLHFPSVRCGSIPGTHSIMFDTDADTITLTHEARNRNGFAQGAVIGAEWIVDKKGFLPFEVCIETILW